MQYGLFLALNKNMVFHLRLLLAITVAFSFVTPVYAATDDVQLQLKWKHAFQFSGYYMAKEKGFYEDVGLNVNIIEGSPALSPISHVIKEVGRYAVSDTSALIARSEGKPIKVLAAIFQHSPLALAVRKDSGINSFEDLQGKRVMMQQGGMDAVILAAMHRSGLTDADFIRLDNSFNINDLIVGNTDAFSVYTTDQPHQLQELGIDYNILKPVDFDINFYGDVLITSEQETKKHHGRAEAFTTASLKGWRYALEHINETVELILKQYNTQGLSPAQLYFEARQTALIVLKDEIELGYMSDYHWSQVATVYSDLKLIDKTPNIDDFIYKPQPTIRDFFNLYRWQFIIVALLMLLLLFATQGFILRRMVRRKTEELYLERKVLKENEKLQTATSSILQMVSEDKSLEEIFESIVLAFEVKYPDMRGSILLLKNKKLYKGASPNLPEDYNNLIEGLEIGPLVGSCGTASFLKKRVIVEDIDNDERWAAFKELVQPFDLKACWSEPIFNAKGDVMGTFAMYYDHPCIPSKLEITDIANAAKLAGLAIERKLAQDSLRKLSQATHHAGESIALTDDKGIIEYVNPAFTELTGYTHEEIIGQVSRVFSGGNEPRSYYEQLIETVSNGGVWNTSTVCDRKDGSKYTSMATISPIFEENNKISHYVIIQNDMTEYEVLEEKFRQAQKMEALGTLVGGIAHDFNNILAGISGNIYLAKKKAEFMPEVLERLIKIEKLSYHAANTVKQLLAFARKGTMEKKDFNLTVFLKDISSLHQSSIPENIIFTQKVCPDELVVNGDATQLQQVLLNLLNNARDAVAEADTR